MLKITMPVRLLPAACLLLAILPACKPENNIPTPPVPDENSAAIILPSGTPPEPDMPRTSFTSASADAPLFTGVPRSLQYEGKPVDPLCFNQLWQQSDEKPAIRLDNCNPGLYTPVEDPDQYSAADGFIGTAYRPSDIAPEHMPALAFIEYKNLGMIDDHSVVLIRESGGGTGLFTSLYLFRRDGANLHVVKNIAGGDRCNGGIETAHIDNGFLHYDVNLTPLALYALGGGETEDVNSADLQDCAVCCYALAHYQIDKLHSVSLADNLSQMLSQSPLMAEDAASPAACFDRLALAQIKSGQTKFSPEKLSAFANKIEKECLSSKENNNVSP